MTADEKRAKRRVTVSAGISKSLAAITAREHEIMERAKRKKTVAISLKLSEYEALLDLAESHDEPTPVVARAAFRYGMAHLKQWASRFGGAESAFTIGELNGVRDPYDNDPTGMRRPGAMEFAIYPPSKRMQPDRREYYGPPRSEIVPAGEQTGQVTIDEVDAVFSNRPVVGGSRKAISLPQGSTEPTPDVIEPRAPHRPHPPPFDLQPEEPATVPQEIEHAERDPDEPAETLVSAPVVSLEPPPKPAKVRRRNHGPVQP